MTKHDEGLAPEQEQEQEQEPTNGGEQFNFVASELKILKFWQDEAIFQKSLAAGQAKRPYIFYDGPPFATGLPHHGHLVASTLKDIVPRYFTMKGYHVSRRFGWDCHGLPIEQEIDKKFGMTALDFVSQNGIKAYNDECRAIVLRYTKEWEKTISRLGRWVDFEHDYKTMDLSFMESIWWVVKSLWDKDLIYKGLKVVPVSTAFGSVLSNFEAGSNYKDVQDPSLTILFSLKEADPAGRKVYFAAWTTTPWTLPSNLGLCVKGDITYALVHDSEREIYFYIAKERIKAYANKKRTLTIVEEVTGAELAGREYTPLFPYFESWRSEGAFRIVVDDYVTTDDGTGIVHQAPAFGEDDYRVMRKHGVLSTLCPVDMYGKFTAEVTDYSGLYVKDADKLIIKRLKEEGLLYEQSTLVHSYPFCPRTDTPLIYRAISSWYVNVEKIKADLVAANSEINWVPEHIKEGRFGKWLDGARDWAISRNRFWGTPLPIWENEVSGKRLCIGSLEELKRYSGVLVTDLHRENIDPITFSVPGEAGVYRRIDEVLDCWFESGSMPYAQLHYPFENRELFEQAFPAEFIAEGLDQTRGWFYTLTVLSAALFKRPAFKNVIVNGMVLAADGKKMSKRLQNYTPPDLLMERYGADALRLFLINSGLVRGEELRFGDEGVKDMVRRALLPWYNSFKFFMTYAQVDGWRPNEHLCYGENVLDRWLLSRLQSLIARVNSEMESYRLYNVVPALFDFIEELTNWYIRLNRRRFWSDGLERDKQEAYSALYTTLQSLSRLMAPFAPFLSEHVYQELREFECSTSNVHQSVHLCDYPSANHQWINAPLEETFNRMKEVILLGRQKRIQEQIKVKTPLRRLTIIHRDPELMAQMRRLEPFIQNELNVKEIHYASDEANYIRLYAKPNAPVLGKRLGKRYAEFQKIIETLDHDLLLKLESGESVEVAGETFVTSDLLLFREALPGSNALSNRFVTMSLDCQLDPDLIQEGLAREIVNRIQKSRKECNFHVADRIEVSYWGDPQLCAVLARFADYICRETLTARLVAVATHEAPSFTIDGMALGLTLKK